MNAHHYLLEPLFYFSYNFETQKEGQYKCLGISNLSIATLDPFLLLYSSIFHLPFHNSTNSSLGPQLHCKNSFSSIVSSLLLTHVDSTQLLHPHLLNGNPRFCSSSTQWQMLNFLSSSHHFSLHSLYSRVLQSVILHGSTCRFPINV